MGERKEFPDTVLRQGQETPFSYQFQTPKRVLGVVLGQGLELTRLVLSDVAGKPRQEWVGEALTEKAYAKTRVYPQQDSLVFFIKNVGEDDLAVQGYFEIESAPLPVPSALPGSSYESTSFDDSDDTMALAESAEEQEADTTRTAQTMLRQQASEARDQAEAVLREAQEAFEQTQQNLDHLEMDPGISAQVAGARARAAAPAQPVMGSVQTSPAPPGYLANRARQVQEARVRAAALAQVQQAERARGSGNGTNGGNGHHHVRTNAQVPGQPGKNQVACLFSRGQAQRLLKLVRGQYVSQLELVDLIAPLERALG